MKAFFTIGENGLLSEEAELIPLTPEEEAQCLIDAAQSAAKQARLRLPFELDAIFKSLSTQARGVFYPLKAGIKLALEQGDLEPIYYTIMAAPVSSPEEEAVKAALLALVPLPESEESP